jgi:hypothetical protein
MLGFLLGLALGYVGRGATSSATVLRPAEASQWSGLIGASPLQVHRNGPTWAWSAVNGSGAEATVVGALRAAVRFTLESGAAQNADSVELARADGRVRARVMPFPGMQDRWRFTIESITPPLQYLTASSTGNDYSTRGAALVDMFDRLTKYAEA